MPEFICDLISATLAERSPELESAEEVEIFTASELSVPGGELEVDVVFEYPLFRAFVFWTESILAENRSAILEIVICLVLDVYRDGNSQLTLLKTREFETWAFDES